MAFVIDRPDGTITASIGKDKDGKDQVVIWPFWNFLLEAVAAYEPSAKNVCTISAAIALEKKVKALTEREELDEKSLRLEKDEYDMVKAALESAIAKSVWKWAFAKAVIDKDNGYYDAVVNAQEILVPVEK